MAYCQIYGGQHDCSNCEHQDCIVRLQGVYLEILIDELHNLQNMNFEDAHNEDSYQKPKQ